MNGPDHYQTAEKLLEQADQFTEADELIAAAQVHATLALTAATIDAAFLTNSDTDPEALSPALEDAVTAWSEATS